MDDTNTDYHFAVNKKNQHGYSFRLFVNRKRSHDGVNITDNT